MSAVVAPARSLDQRMAALAHANRIRVERAQLKQRLRDGDPFLPVILAPPAYLASMRLVDLLHVIPKFGRVRATRVLKATRITTTKTVGGLSTRQRDELADQLRGMGVS